MQKYTISDNDTTKHQLKKMTYRNTRPNLYTTIKKIDVSIYILV